MKTALVFSAGGLFGAWEAGVWRELEGLLAPDIVVGASIGALNGWMVACGCSGEEMERRWLDLDVMSRLRVRVPRRALDGWLDSNPLESLVREIYSEHRPLVEFGVLATETMRLRPRLFRGADVTWQHLAASVGIIGVFRQYRIGGRIYSDGGLLGALPCWAAAEMGAERIIAINCLPCLPSALMTAGVRTLQKVCSFRPPQIPEDVEKAEIRPASSLGTVRESLVWSENNTRRWIEQGRCDARAWLQSRPLKHD